MITRNFNLFLNAGKHIPLVINVNQYDHDEQWCFTLLNDNGEKYIPSTGAIVGIKADRLGIINSGTVNASGQVVINETEQMTAAVGKAVFELLIDDQTHGTANFAVLVEPKPGNNADFSESDLSLLQEAIDGTSAAAIAEGVGNWMDDNLEPGEWVIDSSLTVQGAAADAKKVGDEISDLKSQITNSMPYAVKIALDTILQNVAFKNDGDYSSEKSTFHAWATNVDLLSISAVFNQGGNVISTFDTLDSLRQYLTVTATYSNGTSGTVSGYTLSGDLNEGINTITVSYNGKTTTFNVEAQWIIELTGADLIRGYLADKYESTDANDDYCTSYEEATSGQKTSASKRLSEATFIPIEYGYSYIFKWKSTTTLNISVFAYSETAMTKYENREAFDTSTDRTSLSGGWNAGTLVDGYYTMTATPPQSVGSSPVATMRFNFKTNPEVAFSANGSELTEMIITREATS